MGALKRREGGWNPLTDYVMIQRDIEIRTVVVVVVVVVVVDTEPKS